MKRSSPLLISIACALLAACAGTQGPGKASSNVCEVHQVAMPQKKVPVAYGLPYFQEYDRQMAEAATRSFPHAVVSVEGGCIVPKRGSKQVKVFQCPTCLQEKAQWISLHPRPTDG